MAANDRQVGGNHHRAVSGEQHWDRLVRLFGWPGARPYFVGNITQYVERAHRKNGVQDLEKAAHYLEKLIELERQHEPDRVSTAMPENGVQPVSSESPVHLGRGTPADPT